MHLAIRTQFLGLLVLVLAAYGIERLIVTDAEELQTLAEDAATAVQGRDWTGLASLLDEDFTYAGRDRAATLAYVRSLVSRYQPTATRIDLTAIEIDGDEAQAEGLVRATALGRSAGLEVRAWFRRTADGWRLRKIEGGPLSR